LKRITKFKEKVTKTAWLQHRSTKKATAGSAASLQNGRTKLEKTNAPDEPTGQSPLLYKHGSREIRFEGAPSP